MALSEAKLLVRLSRMRVMYGIDPGSHDYCYEVGLFSEDGGRLKKLIFDLPNVNVLAAELEACAAGAESAHRRVAAAGTGCRRPSG